MYRKLKKYECIHAKWAEPYIRWRRKQRTSGYGILQFLTRACSGSTLHLRALICTKRENLQQGQKDKRLQTVGTFPAKIKTYL